MSGFSECPEARDDVLLPVSRHQDRSRPVAQRMLESGRATSILVRDHYNFRGPWMVRENDAVRDEGQVYRAGR